MATRRQLRFDSLDEAVADAENLLAKGYEKAGNWDLGQCCGHLANFLEYAMDGFPRIPVFFKPLIWFMRKTVGPGLLQKYVATGELPSGKPTIPQSVPTSGNDTVAVARLRDMVERAKVRTDDPIPSPFFGPMSKNEWVQLNCMHAAHHLSFLVPKT